MTAATPPPAVILVVWWFDAFGGMERHVAELALALRRAGRMVTVFTEMPLPATNRYGHELRDAGIRVVAPPEWRHALASRLERIRFFRLMAGLNRPPAIGWPGIADEYRRHQHAPASSRRLMRALEQHRRSNGPSVVHVHGCRLGQHRVLQWASARAIPCLYTEHLTIADWGPPADPAAPRVIAATADVIACVSQRSRDDLLARLDPRREVEIVRHILRAPDAVPALPSDGRPPLIVAVGRLAPHKGYDVLLTAAARLREAGTAFRLQIAGGGSELGALEALRQRLGLNGLVEFLGPIDPTDVASLWCRAAVAVTASLTEGQPLAVIEAMAYGRAIVATRVGGIPEVIRHGDTGLLVAPGDAAALAEALLRVLNEPGLGARLGAAARRSFEDDGWREDAVTEQALELYDKVLRVRAARMTGALRSPPALAGGIQRVQATADAAR